MEKELNLIEILKGAPKGIELYSPIFGECKLDGVSKDFIYVSGKHEGFLNKNGTYYNDCGECMLFPSKDNRDWSTFGIEKDDFQVGDHVKVKLSDKVYLIKQIKETEVLVSNIINSLNNFEFLIDKSIISEKVTKFNPKWLKPFDRVLVRNYYDAKWFTSFFSYLSDNKNEDDFYVATNGFSYKYCIPFNEETKHLIGTTDDEPEFYKI